MTRTGTHANPEEHLDDVMRSFSTAMLITHGEGRSMHARPMHVAGVENGQTLWFVTAFSSGKTAELLADPEVAVAMQGNARFASISGKAEVVIDRPDKIEALWSETWRPWFPGGPKDPELALLCVRVEDAELWDYRGAAGVRYVYDAVKHALRGERMTGDGGASEAHEQVSG